MCMQNCCKFCILYKLKLVAHCNKILLPIPNEGNALQSFSSEFMDSWGIFFTRQSTVYTLYSQTFWDPESIVIFLISFVNEDTFDKPHKYLTYLNPLQCRSTIEECLILYFINSNNSNPRNTFLSMQGSAQNPAWRQTRFSRGLTNLFLSRPCGRVIQ